MARRIKVQVYLSESDWNYIRKLAYVVGSNGGSTICRECIESFVGVMRRALGDDLDELDKRSVVDFTRVMFLETSNALKDIAMLYEKGVK